MPEVRWGEFRGLSVTLAKSVSELSLVRIRSKPTLRIRSATPQPCSSLQCTQASCSDAASFISTVTSFGRKVSVCCLCKRSKPPFNTFHGVCSLISSLTEYNEEQSWVIFVKLLRCQYGNIGSRNLCLNSTIPFFSTSVKHIQRVVARHLGTQRCFFWKKLIWLTLLTEKVMQWSEFEYQKF
ncbi:hypothetical protein HID58_085116 [Brassica napus]|uniref:Uncharacterized protein n=1 Tax=Brassica napus TaxID=3708 RepID=A0ABQ7XLP3_BRANA|nr:hypothetical protein HID58_085116 [Brassica napus]